MTTPPPTSTLLGGPADGLELQGRIATLPVVQVPATDGRGGFATYRLRPGQPGRHLFVGFDP